MKPPFQLTPAMFNLVVDIGQMLGRFQAFSDPVPQPRLRRENRIRTVHGSVAIEGNTLGLDKVTALFDSKRVVGPKKDILEVQNAIFTYEQAPRFNPFSARDLLKAHGLLMKGLVPDAGRWRDGNVGIFKNGKVDHVAPKARMVPGLVQDLFDSLKKDRETHALIRSCVLHYELEFIHPFSDGNGRMGRLWQHVFLMKENPIFQYAPMESVIRERQDAYYRALEASDRAGDSTAFIEFGLESLRDALSELFSEMRPGPVDAGARLESARRLFGMRWFTRKEYLALQKTLSSATASRDLKAGVEKKLLDQRGERALTEYRFRKANPDES